MSRLPIPKLNPRDKRAVLVGGILVLALAIVFGWVLPRFDRIKSLDRAIAAERQRLQEVRRLHSAVVELNEREAKAQELLGRGADGDVIPPHFDLGDAVHHSPAHPADPLPAVMVKGHRLPALQGQPFVQNIQHLRKGHVRIQAFQAVRLEPAGSTGTSLPPDPEVKGYCFSCHKQIHKVSWVTLHSPQRS